jgi:catechol 2,3-dioxygenase-like lactoylglutathione lyase family enzyme
MKRHLRIARPVTDIDRTRLMYCAGLDLQVIGGFTGHNGFDGVMLGRAGMDYHFEFVVSRDHPVTPSPTGEDLLVFYLPDQAQWQAACVRMLAAGFHKVASLNPYWDVRGATFEDPDGYRSVLQNAAWTNAETAIKEKGA